MKKYGLILLCFALFWTTASAGAAYLYFSPRGVLRPEGPEEVMQAKIDTMDRAAWRAEYVRLCPAPVSEFEDAQTVAGHIFDAAVTTDKFTFRAADSAEGKEQDYIISAGDADVLTAHLTYVNSQWELALRPLDALRGTTRTLTVTVPEDTMVILNGKPVGGQYMIDPAVLYPNMTDLELRFSSYPHLVRYAVEGIYEAAQVEAQRSGGLVLTWSDGTDWSYTVPDAGAYTLSVTAPEDAAVTVNGAELTLSDVSASTFLATRLDIPEELQPFLPAYSVYTAGGLYTPADEISAVLPDGTVLTEEVSDGAVSYSLPGSQALYEANHDRVEAYLRALCEYGAGHTGLYGPGLYVVQDTPLRTYLFRAIDSLHWTTGFTITYEDISSSDYIALGDSGFLCRGHVLCTSKSRHETVELDMDYEMLWVFDGNYWVIRDMAFL